jgi:hypothetical protein
MSKGGAIIVLGFLTAFLPFTGFSSGFETILAIVFGVATMVLGFLVRQERLWLLRSRPGEQKTDSYAESRPH